MEIKECLDYRGNGKKYAIIEKGERYSCYIEPFNCASNFVVTGDGKNKDFKYIAGCNYIDDDTELGLKILSLCQDKYMEGIVK